MTTTTKIRLDDGMTVLVPTAMYRAVLGDAKAAGFVNLAAAESLWYELLDWETGSDASADWDAWIRHLEIAE